MARSPSPDGRRTARPTGRRAGRVRPVLAAATAALALGGAIATAAPPAPPHSVAILAGDDGVILDGYGSGQIRVDVLRGGIPVATTGPLPVTAGTPVEVNHVGSGTCWQTLTPDIVHGDVVRVTHGATVEESVTRFITVQDPVQVNDATVAVHGTGQTPADIAATSVRLINPAFNALYGGQPFLRTPDHGTVAADPSPDPNDWVATFVLADPPNGTVADAVQAALAAETEAGWASANGAEATDALAGAAGGPALPDCPQAPAGAYAATRATPTTLTAATPTFVVDGVARLDTTSVSVTIDDGPGGGAPVVTAPVAPATSGGGKHWTISIPAGQIDPLANGTLTVTPTFTPAPAVAPVGLTVDKDRGPGTLFTGGPAAGAHVANTAATFTFAATVAGSTFECSLDTAPFATCDSPFALTGLADATHTLRVRGTAALQTGDTATRTWTVDTTPPVAAVVAGPAPRVRSTAATFDLSVDEAAATLLCALDAGPFAPCTDPHTVKGLAERPHTLTVRAVDLAGNIGTSAPYAWTVDRTAPAFTASVPNLANTRFARTGALPLAARCVNEACTIAVVARVVVPPAAPGGRTRTFTLRPSAIRAAAGARTRPIARLNAVQLRAVRQALRGGLPVRVHLTFTGTDAAGNRAVRLPGFTLRPSSL